MLLAAALAFGAYSIDAIGVAIGPQLANADSSVQDDEVAAMAAEAEVRAGLCSKFDVYGPSYTASTPVGTMQGDTFAPALDVNLIDRTPPEGMVFSHYYCERSGCTHQPGEQHYLGYHRHGGSSNSITCDIRAIFVSQELTVSFESHGGSSIPQSQKIVYGETASDPKAPGTRAGYIFQHWSIADGGDAYDFSKGVTADMTLHAVWEPIGYQVRFNVNVPADAQDNSEVTPAYSQSLTYDVTAALMLNFFSVGGYDFIEWNTSPKGTGTAYRNGSQVRNLTAIQGDTIDLYAQWAERSVDVSFAQQTYSQGQLDAVHAGGAVSNGGSAIGAVHGRITSEATAAAGYTFGGWYAGATKVVAGVEPYNLEADGAMLTVRGSKEVPLRTRTLTARFDANTDTPYRVEYYYQNDEGVYERWGFSEHAGITDTLARVSDDDLDPDGGHAKPAPREGVRWVLDASAPGSRLQGNIDGTGGCVLQVHFKIQYWVEYATSDERAGSVSADQNGWRDRDSQLGAAPAVTASAGYSFTEWAPGHSAAVAVREALSFIALFRAHAYQVVFHRDEPAGAEASGEMAPQEMTYDTEVQLSANAFAVKGYSFDGWRSADGDVYADEQAVVNLTDQDGATIDLHAQWSEDQVQIGFACETYTDGQLDDRRRGGELDRLGASMGVVTGATSSTASALPGYTFRGWYAGDERIDDATDPEHLALGADGAQLMVKGTKEADLADATYTARFATDMVPYAIEYYYQDPLDGSWPASASWASDGLMAFADTDIAAQAEPSAAIGMPAIDAAAVRYAADTVHEGYVAAGSVAGTGDTVLKVFFKVQYRIAFKSEDAAKGILVFPDADPSEARFAFVGDAGEGGVVERYEWCDWSQPTPAVPTAVAQPGYRFAGWQPEPAGTVTGAQTYVATFEPTGDTAYAIEYYYQAPDGTWPDAPTFRIERADGRAGEVLALEDADLAVLTHQDNEAIPALDAEAERHARNADANGRADITSAVIDNLGRSVLKVHYKVECKTVFTSSDDEKGVVVDSVPVAAYMATPASIRSAVERWFGFGDAPVAPTARSAEGYLFDGWSPELPEAVSGPGAYEALWSAIPAEDEPSGDSGEQDGSSAAPGDGNSAGRIVKRPHPLAAVKRPIPLSATGDPMRSLAAGLFGIAALSLWAALRIHRKERERSA